MTLVVDNSQPAAPVRTYRRRRSYPRYRRRRSYRSRGRYNRRRRTRSKGMTKLKLRSASKFALCQIDPFNNDCIGAKIPDSNTFPSCGFRVDDSTGFVVDATYGMKVACFMPSMKTAYVGGAAASASTWTWTAAYGGGYSNSRLTAFASQYTLFRPVGHGLKLTCPLAPTSVTGNVHIAVIASSDMGSTTWNFPTSLAGMSNAMFYQRYSLASLTQQPLTVVNKFLDCTAQRYIDPNSDGIENSTDATLNTNGWAAILVVVEGAPVSTTPLQVEYVTHVEAIPSSTGLSTSTPAAAYDVSQLQEVSRIAGETPAAFQESQRSSYMSQVVQAMQSGMYGAANNIFDRVVIPAAYGFGGYAARTAFNGIAGVTNLNRNTALM